MVEDRWALTLVLQHVAFNGRDVGFGLVQHASEAGRAETACIAKRCARVRDVKTRLAFENRAATAATGALLSCDCGIRASGRPIDKRRNIKP
jgi:hypothetical protein